MTVNPQTSHIIDARAFCAGGEGAPEARKALGQDVSSVDKVAIALVSAGDASKQLFLAVAPVVLTTSGTYSGGAYW